MHGSYLCSQVTQGIIPGAQDHVGALLKRHREKFTSIHDDSASSPGDYA